MIAVRRAPGRPTPPSLLLQEPRLIAAWPPRRFSRKMRACDPLVSYLVGTPKGRLNRLEKHLLDKPWRNAREGVDVKLLEQEKEL